MAENLRATIELVPKSPTSASPSSARIPAFITTPVRTCQSSPLAVCSYVPIVVPRPLGVSIVYSDPRGFLRAMFLAPSGLEFCSTLCRRHAPCATAERSTACHSHSVFGKEGTWRGKSRFSIRMPLRLGSRYMIRYDACSHVHRQSKKKI
jgi:hypothetical protein